MWESRNFGNDQGGGFMNSGAGGFNSPAGKPDKGTRRIQNVVPVCIRQILECPDETLKVANVDVHMFTIVALVRRIEVLSTKLSYLLDDCSGGIAAIYWIETDDNGEHTHEMPCIIENTYCRIFGSMRTTQGKKHVFIFRIQNLKSLNEVTRHILEVMHTPLKLKALSSLDTMKAPTTDSSVTGMSNSFMTSTNMSDPTGFSPQQTLVYNAIMKNSKDIGAKRDEVIKELTGRMNAAEVTHIIDFLCNEGHIYTTVDDEHFRCTDN